jgi:hypothetical protein
MNLRKNISKSFILLVLFTLFGCSDNDSKQNAAVVGETFAVIAGVASDFSSSEISIVNSVSPYDALEGFASQALSDITVATYGEQFYRIGRYQQDNITRYDFNNPNLVEWQFGTDDPASGPSNPYDIVFVNETKAYVIRYGASSIWVVDPSVSANDEDLFKTGEIDLSAYDSDGVPQMSAAVLHNDRLYVVMQGMDASYTPGTAYLAVIDVATDQEINVNSEPLRGKALLIKNPSALEIIDNNILVVGVGRHERSWVPAPAEYTGGIEKISLSDFSSSILIDDGDATIHPYGNITNIAIVSSSKGYFVGVPSYGKANIYQFNPTSGAVVASPLTIFSDLDIQDVSLSPQGELWVGIGDAENPEIKIIDTSDNSVIDTVLLSSNPRRIIFTSSINLND